MQIDIQARQFSLTKSLNYYTERRIRLALTRFEERIQRVSIWLSDASGPKGGKSKHCRLQVVLAGKPDVIVEDTQENLYAAINRAVDRAGRSLIRKIERQHSRMYRSRPRVLESPSLS